LSKSARERMKLWGRCCGRWKRENSFNCQGSRHVRTLPRVGAQTFTWTKIVAESRVTILEQ
jgi:hypothetical protein